MKRVAISVSAILVAASIAQAMQESRPSQSFFSEKRVDFWRAGDSHQTTTPPSTLSVSESLWAEPMRLPDGRVTTYVPPRPVLEFLENPTKENARKYLAWQTERLEKMQKAASMLGEIAREREAKAAKASHPAGASLSLTYFKKPGCPYCKMEDSVLQALKEKIPDLKVKTLEPGDEQDLWKRLAVTAVPAIEIRAASGRSVLLRGYADLGKIQNAIEGIVREER